MKRVKRFLVLLSALLCLAAMVAWGFGIAGLWGFVQLEKESLDPPRSRNPQIQIASSYGAIRINADWSDDGLSYKSEWRWSGVWLYAESHRVWENISVGLSASRGFLRLPYWLLILLFATAPALRLRRDYVARREKKLLGEAVAQKRAEHPHLDIKEPRE